MTISKAEMYNELRGLGLNRDEAIKRVLKLDNRDDSGVSKLSDQGDQFVPSVQNIDDANTAFLRAGASPTSSDMYQQALNAIPTPPDLGALQNQFMNIANGGGDPELDAEASRLTRERKFWDNWDAKQRQHTLYLAMILKGIQESIQLAKSAA